MGTISAHEFVVDLAGVTEYLDKLGYAVVIIKKPRPNNCINMFDGKAINEKTWFGATNVRFMREDKGLTVYQLAKEMGVDKNLVVRIENDYQRHAYNSVKRFADYFGCSIQELLR